MHHEIVLPVQPAPAAVASRTAVRGDVWQRAGALLRLVKPGIVTAELAAALAGMLLASSVIPPVAVILITTIAVGLAASGAAMANGLMEAASDRLMPRVAARCRALDLAGEKLVCAVALAAMGASLLVGVLFLNLPTTLLLGAAIFSYLYLYTARQKRTSPWALLVGGIAGGIPPLIGAAAVGAISAAPLLLALLIYCWQLPHFWFLALQYREHYRLAGVPVFPLMYGAQLTKRLILVSCALLLPLTLSFRLLGATSSVCTVVMLLAGVAFLACSAWALRHSTRYRQGFFASLLYLALLLAALIVDAAVNLA